MPMRETGDEVGQDASEQGDTQGAGVDPPDASIRARQLRLNEQGGKQCICGRWEDFARVDGGWASTRMGDECGEEGEYGCQNVAAGEQELNGKLCLLCQAGPVDECSEVGVPVTVRAPPAQWDNMSDEEQGEQGEAEGQDGDSLVRSRIFVSKTI